VLLVCATVTWLACTERNPLFLVVDSGSYQPGNGGGTRGQTDSQGTPEVNTEAAPPTPNADAALPDSSALDFGRPEAHPPVDVPSVAPIVDAAPVDLVDVPDAPLAMDTVVAVDAGPTLTTGLIGYWRFDETDEAVIIRDGSGQGHHGRIEGTTTGAGFVAGRFGRAYHITQVNRDFGIRVEATPAIKNIKQYTLAAWVYRYVKHADYDTIISRQLNATDAEVLNLSISFDVAKLYASDRIPTGEVTVAWARTPAPVGAWFHLAGTFDGSSLTLYQNGVLADKVPYTLAQPPTETPLYLATNKNPGESQPFYGTLDEVMLYDVALPPDLIAALARGDRPNVP
jgi:hypothetical protein